jgi:P27 family predicted phage terminase small subunit
MRGRKPKPTARQISEGDPCKLGKGKLQAKLESEPDATRGLPDCPRHLKGRARSAWKFWAEELAQMNLDRRPDAMMLEGACVNYEAAVRAYEEVQKLGDVAEEPIMSRETGECVGFRLKKNPWVSVRERSWLLVKAFCSEFGLAPVPRTRLTIEKSDGGDKALIEALSQPRQSPQMPIN